MSPIDLIRRGIAGGSWKDVCEGFARLTGERLQPPASDGIPESLRYTLRTLQGHLSTLFSADSTSVEPAPGPGEEDDTDDEEEEEEEPAPAEPPRAPPEKDPSQKFRVVHGEAVNEQGKRAARREAVDTTSHKNLFKDDHTLAKRNLAESARASKSFQGKDHRPAYKPVKVTCSRCSRSEKVHPDNVPQRVDPADETPQYICDRCMGRGRD